MKRKTTEKLIIMLLVAAFLALSACKTCKCPAYSYKQIDKQKDILNEQQPPANLLISHLHKHAGLRKINQAKYHVLKHRA